MMAKSFYEQLADEFMESLAGQMSKISRDEFIAKLKEKEPDEEAFRIRVEEAKRIIQSKLDEMQMNMDSGQPLPSQLDLSEAEALLNPRK